MRPTRGSINRSDSPIFRTEERLLGSLDGVDLTIAKVILDFPGIAKLAVSEISQ